MTADEFYADFQNDPTYIELQEQLADLGVTLGGSENIEDLVEMLQDRVGDLV